jgi:wyosine [tRNA(Phe)-imidazoG37] synthetase (radical SAM superfamily)
MISFGPIPSRRLGKSLGINNIVSLKTCSYNCIYCQVGKTRVKSIHRHPFFKPEVIYDKVLQHIERLHENDYPDYLTFVSNGEPTLDINLGNSIKLLKNTGIPIAVISNASMLFEESVRNDLSLADWVSLKIDAADNKTWQLINNPSPDLNFENHIKNIILFAGYYKGKLNTETMIAGRINDSAGNISGVAHIVNRINPFKAYLSIPTRPPSDKTVVPPGPEKLNRAWQIFNDLKINTELLTGFEGIETGYTGNIYEDILNITAVHPLREDTLIALVKKDNADFQIVDSLIRQKLIKQVTYKDKIFYLREYHRQF